MPTKFSHTITKSSPKVANVIFCRMANENCVLNDEKNIMYPSNTLNLFVFQKVETITLFFLITPLLKDLVVAFILYITYNALGGAFWTLHEIKMRYEQCKDAASRHILKAASLHF